MTDVQPEPTNAELAQALLDVADSNRAIVAELQQIRPDVRRSIRVNRALLAAVVVLVVVVAFGGYRIFDSYRDGACERGNNTKAATIDATSIASEVATERAARELGADPARAEEISVDVGDEVRRGVSEDPRLAPRDCS